MSDFYNVKSYRLTIEHRPDYLYGYVEGQYDSYEVSHAYWREVVRECKEGSHTRVLVNESFEEPASLAETQHIASSLSKTEIRNLKIAFVDTTPDHEGLNEFAARVSINRGMRVKVFENEQIAERWLLAD